MINATINIIFSGISLLTLILIAFYNGSYDNFVDNYGANIAFSFGAFFIWKTFKLRYIDSRFEVAMIIFTLLSFYEISQGIGIYPGVYDPYDFLFNALGLIIALIMDSLIYKYLKR